MLKHPNGRAECWGCVNTSGCLGLLRRVHSRAPTRIRSQPRSASTLGARGHYGDGRAHPHAICGTPPPKGIARSHWRHGRTGHTGWGPVEPAGTTVCTIVTVAIGPRSSATMVAPGVRRHLASGSLGPMYPYQGKPWPSPRNSMLCCLARRNRGRNAVSLAFLARVKKVLARVLRAVLRAVRE